MVSHFFLIPALAAHLSAAPRPLRVVVMVDQTGSTLTTRVPRLTVDDFADLLALLLQNGGEVAVGVIRDRSNRPLLRCRVEQKPLRHAQPPGEKLNPFIRQRLIRAFTADKEKEDRVENAWLREAEQQVYRFRERLRGLLDARLAGRTDIQGAVLRSDLFLAEPEDGWRQPTRRVVLFHSDGIDTVHGPTAAMKSGATVLVVNGSANLGALAAFNPVRLESFAAALRYIRSRSEEE